MSPMGATAMAAVACALAERIARGDERREKTCSDQQPGNDAHARNGNGKFGLKIASRRGLNTARTGRGRI